MTHYERPNEIERPLFSLLICTCFEYAMTSCRREFESHVRENPLEMDRSEDDPDSTDAVNLLEDLDFFLHEDSTRDQEAADKEEDGETKEACALCAAAGTNPLRATSLGHIQCLEALLARKEDKGTREGVVKVAEHRSEHGANAAHVAAKMNNASALSALIRYDSTCMTSRDDRGATPAHVAAYNGSYECLKAILDAGGAPMPKAGDGATPLHFAAARGQLDCVQCLATRSGVNVNEKTKSGATPSE